MDLDLIKTFLAVESAGSMTDAAANLGRTGAAVSQQIGRLETSLGVKVFERGAGGVTLTPAGDVVKAHAEGVLGAVADLENEARLAASRASRRLRLEAFSSASIHLLPRVMREVREIEPTVTISFAELDDAEPFANVASGKVDLSIGYEYDDVPLDKPPRLQLETLGREPMDAILPVDHRFAKRRSVRLEQLQEFDWVLFPTQNVATISVVKACNRLGFTPRILSESNDYQVVQAMVQAGLGISLLPRMVSSGIPKTAAAVVPIAGDVPCREVFVAYRSSNASPLLDTAITALQSLFRLTI